MHQQPFALIHKLLQIAIFLTYASIFPLLFVYFSLAPFRLLPLPRSGPGCGRAGGRHGRRPRLRSGQGDLRGAARHGAGQGRGHRALHHGDAVLRAAQQLAAKSGQE